MKRIRKRASNAKAVPDAVDCYPSIKDRLHHLGNKETAVSLQRFFKTGQGEYSAGDVFIGIKVPPLRKLSAEFEDAPLETVQALLKSRIHEERTLALMILGRQFARADDDLRKQIYDFYLSHTSFINNWDLVDGSAPYIVGPFLWKRDRGQLYAFAKSKSLWERRIAILSTLYFIRQNDFDDALKISKLRSPTIAILFTKPSLDASRNRQTQSSCRGSILEDALPRNAAHNAALRHRALSGSAATKVSPWQNLTLIRTSCRTQESRSVP